MSLTASAACLGSRIEEARKEKRISQGGLAQKVDCSRRTIMELEKGGNVSILTAFRVLSVLGLEMEIIDRRKEKLIIDETSEH